jgi:hypothetical protein
MTVSNRSARKQPPALPATKTKTFKVGGIWILLGCAGFVALFIVGIAIFTFLFNAVSAIFDGPTIDMWQGLAIWLLLSIIGGAFRTVVNR